MRLTVFRSGKGDCLLLEGNSGGRILVDGGMREPYRTHVSPALAKLRAVGKKLDLVYISHIDEDHIAGILELVNVEMSWRVYEHQIANGNPNHPVPRFARPPKVKKIWHNAFHEQLDEDPGVIEDTLAAMASVLNGATDPALLQAAATHADLATSVKQAILVSRRIGARQLAIPLNPDAGGKLMMRRDGQAPVRVGSLRLTVLGPSGPHLLKLRREWKTWLDDNADDLQEIRDNAADDEDLLQNNDLGRFRAHLARAAARLGDPGSVTAPNVASLTLFVKDGDQTLLLTGDARADHLLEGLRATGLLADGGRLHVNVLKVQHHGAGANMDQAFCDAVTADHYVFCGNGESENPEPGVLQLIARSRFNDDDSSKFKFWFNCSKEVSTDDRLKTHMTGVEDTVKALQAEQPGRLRSRFLRSGSGLDIL